MELFLLAKHLIRTLTPQMCVNVISCCRAKGTKEEEKVKTKVKWFSFSFVFSHSHEYYRFVQLKKKTVFNEFLSDSLCDVFVCF